MRPLPALFLDRRKLSLASLWQIPQLFLSIPGGPGLRLTRRKRWNLWLSRFEMLVLSERLRSFPTMLTVEATNRCDLRCPGCHTGVGDVGRETGSMPLELYRAVLRELGDYLFWIEFSNWGEPLLAENLYTMIREAVRQGISTLVSTNLDAPLDHDGAERLVSSRLHVLQVPIAGARAETHAKYRVGGNLATVIENCRMLAEAKKRIGSETPYVRWEYLAFDFNEDEIDMARALAAEREIQFWLTRGGIVGRDWTPRNAALKTPSPYFPMPCAFLWQRAVVNGDGGISPCRQSFAAADDMGRMATHGRTGSSSFREVWNGAAFQTARRLFRGRNIGAERDPRICTDCSVRVDFVNYVDHHDAGHPAESFRRKRQDHENFNYFWDWNRKRLHSQ